MSLKSRRFIPLFGIAQSLLLAPALGQLLSLLGQRMLRRFPGLQHNLRWRMVPPVLALGLGGWLLAPYPLSSRAFLYLTSQDSFPVEALNVADANQLAGKVFAYYEWGGYVDLRTDGRLQVYIDGRADTVFDDQIYRRYTRVLGLAQGWEDLVEASGADYFLWPKRQRRQIEALRESGKWRMLYSDHIAVLLVRSDHAPQAPLLPSPDSAWREFTLGWAASGTKQLADAEAHLQRALEIMPNFRMACEWLANVQARSNRLADAEATLERCQKSFPDRERRKELLAVFRSRAEVPQ
jgi:tetratricopeptide (TPR) repeat protein